MRGLFIALLVANLSFAGWLYMQLQPEQPLPAREMKSDVPTIVLLREMPLQADTVVASASDQHTPQPVPAPAEPQISDMAGDTGGNVAGSDNLRSDEVEQSEVATESCYTLGPFRQMDKLRLVIRAIKDNVQEASFRSSEEREQSLFWVYLKPESDLQSAKNTTRMLRKKRIKDSYIVADGKNKLGISLGYFKEKARAYALRDKIARSGFEPRIDPVFRDYTIYWLDYKLSPDSNSQAILNGISLDKNISRFDRACG